MIVEASVRGKKSVDGRVTMVEPSRTIFSKTGALVCRVTATPRKGKVPVRIYNPHDEPIVIHKHTTLGILREIDETVAWRSPTADDYDDVEEQQRPEEATDDLASALHGLYGSRAEPEEQASRYREIHEYARLPVKNDGSTDDRVPEHLQQLYEASVEALNRTQRRSLRSLLTEYEDIFARNSKDIGRARDVKHHIDTQFEAPVSQRPSTSKSAHGGDMKKCEDAIRSGIIRLSEPRGPAMS